MSGKHHVLCISALRAGLLAPQDGHIDLKSYGNEKSHETFRGSPRAYRARPSAWPSPSGPLGWRSKVNGAPKARPAQRDGSTVVNGTVILAP